MKNILRVIAIGLTLTINSVAAVPAGAQCTALVPSNDCSPGGGSKTTDCQMEWRFTPMPKKLVNATPTPDVFRGRPRNRIICYEGDPRCDFDPNLTNHSCTMRTEIFINNQDPNLTSCSSASGIAIFEVKRPNPASASLDAADTANIQTLENQAGSGGFGVTVVRKRTPVQTGNPNTTQNLGSPPLDLIVPQPQRSDLSYTTGNKRVRIQSSNQLEKRDPDSLLLTCRISTCGNNIIETDHELCDDGNRTNGDGCNQACQTEVVIGTPTNTATITPTQTPAETPTVTNTPVQTATNTHTNTPANTATAGNTFTQSPTRTPSSTPTATNTPQSTGTQTPTRTPTLTPTITNTPLGTSTQTPTRTLTTTPTQTPTGAATPTATAGAAIGLHAFNILPGKPLCRGTCVGGPVPGRRCQLSSGAFGCGGGTCQSKICYGGATPGATCAFDGACGATDGCQMAPPVGSCAIVQGDILPATRVPLLGNLMLDIGAPDGNGVATVTIPAANTVLDAASVPGIGFVCVLQGTDGTGIIDCNGGATNIDTLLELDHNTATAGVCMRGSNAGGACASDAQCPGASTTGACNLFNSGSANGLPDDPTCTASLLQPDSSLSVACPEGERVCVGGTKQGFPCVGGTDCPGSTCSATQCGSGVNVGMACADDSNCPAGRCATFVCRGGSNNGNFCTLDTDCPTGVCIPCSSNDTVTGHTGVCSSPTKITQSGTFASGGLQVAMPLAIQILATDGSENGPDALPCTGDDTPEGPPAPVTVVLSTGVTTIKIYDANNQNNNKIAPGELCAGSPCGTQLTGTPFSCATLATSVTAGGTLGGGFPAVDTLASDIATTFQFVSQ